MKKKLIKFNNDENLDFNTDDNLNLMQNRVHEKASELLTLITDASENAQDESLRDKYKNYLSAIDEIEDYQSILFHQNIAYSQRVSYSHQIKNIDFLTNKLLIELDFKQKFVIGLSPRQVSREYYNQTMRSCLGNRLIL